MVWGFRSWRSSGISQSGGQECCTLHWDIFEECFSYNDDVLDIIRTQRRNGNATADSDLAELLSLDAPPQLFPAALTSRYWVCFKPLTPSGDSGNKALAVRNVRGSHLDHLITVRGIATPVSDVKPYCTRQRIYLRQVWSTSVPLAVFTSRRHPSTNSKANQLKNRPHARPKEFTLEGTRTHWGGS
ncbi:hypothetical protein HOY82DRAFT_582505 [Tuber indicum]|nr:hypothetical protein HOY82DRAFT_582505 [Tuber indicum]